MKRLTILLGLVISAAFARGDYETINIAADEKIAEYIRFDAESWEDVEDAILEGGRLIENAIWEGKHIIHSDLYIPSGVTLTINPGAQISFDDGVMLKVEDGGSLNLIGEEGNEVVIRGSDKKGIVLQSSAANYYDNNFVDIEGFNFSRFASFSISDTDAFFASGVARVPVNVSGSRSQPFSFDWVATVNGDTLVEGTMNWNNVSEGKKEIVVNFPTELKDVTEIKIQVVKARCAIAARNEAKINLSAFMTLPIETDEEIGEYIAFESEEWNLAQGGEAGRLTQNTIWEGEHIVTGIVYIPSGVTLTIRPGAVIKFAAGTYIKIEDGATLNLYGEEGNDIVLKGLEKDTAFTGIVKMSSGTVNENEFVQIEGFTFGTFPRISLNNSETFRTSGLAIIPVTISGSRSSAFSFEWVAETNNVPYKTGSVRWGSTNDGTKNININFGSELDGLDSFVVRAVTNRVSYASPSSCTVKIADFDHLNIEVADNQAEYIKFSRPEGEYDGGRLDANTTWAGFHTIGSDLYIPSGVTLTISAGTIVEFAEGTMIKIEDGGALNVVGANGNDVIFKKAEGVENCAGLNKMNSGSYTDNMYVQFVGVPYGGYPYVSVNPATTYREAGKVYVAFTLSGASRDQAFNVDWKTAKGQTGTVGWGRSSDGTKWAEIPVDSSQTGGTEEYAIEITAARACNPSTAKNTITILEPDFVDTTGVSMTTEITSSKSFKIDEAIKRHSIFLNEVEPVRYSGIWREHSEEAVKQQVVLESDNGRKILVEAGLGESGEIAFRPNDYPTGYYELKHEIVDRTGDALEILTKVFSVPELDDVVLHGGTITSNELWKAGKVHVVYEPISVPALYTLLIEPGAIVKFYTNSGITLQNGAALFANGIVFTHIDDDTVGGDTLSDGFTALPPMDAYYLNGDFTFGDDAELRNITQKTALSGTLSGAKMLSKGSTYRVSGNFTIANGGKLTIPAGTVLKMEAGAQITVNAGGELIANGSRAAPIVITSIRDDSISGDTNGDGDKTLPQGGDWQGVWIYGDAKFAYTTLMYAGPSSERGILQTSGSGNLEMDNCFVAHAKFDGIWNWGGTISVRNSIIIDTGWAAAPYRGSKNEYINCVFYGNDVMTCYWSHWSGNPLFSNCVVAECGLGWCQTANNTYDNPPNAVRVENCLFYNPPGYSSQACSRVGSDGNIWDNPLFVDPENGDFRIREGSPCVDAANEETAPELDYYGQPRVNAPDIGICELLPRDVTSDIDLVPESVRADQEVKPGQIMFVKWTIRNAGGTVVDDTWRDTVSLVSTSGREVVLGEKLTTGVIAVGGTIFCSGYFTVPALEEGEWYPKVNVNSYHDIFEGLLSKNNALVGNDTVNVKINEVTQEGVDGIVNAGMPTVIKLKIAADDPKRMVHIDVAAGTKVYYGFGFVPSMSNYSGSVIASAGGAYFRVPNDVEDVYVTLEGDTTTQYEIYREDLSIIIQDVSPKVLPSSGNAILMIRGAGFNQNSSVELISSDGETILCSIVSHNEGILDVTVNCDLLSKGSEYNVQVSHDANFVLWSRLQCVNKTGIPDVRITARYPKSIRQMRENICYVDYCNVGDAIALAPAIVLASDDNIEFASLSDDSSWGSRIAMFAKGKTLAYLMPGESGSFSVRFRSASADSSSLSLSTVDERKAIELSEMENMLADIDLTWITENDSSLISGTWGDLITRLREALEHRIINLTDSDTIRTLLLRYINIKRSGKVDFIGRLRDLDGMPVIDVVHIYRNVNGHYCLEGVQKTDSNGTFSFLLEPESDYILRTDVCSVSDGGRFKTADLASECMFNVNPEGFILQCDIDIADRNVELCYVAVNQDFGETIAGVRSIDGSQVRFDHVSAGKWSIRSAANGIQDSEGLDVDLEESRLGLTLPPSRWMRIYGCVVNDVGAAISGVELICDGVLVATTTDDGGFDVVLPGVKKDILFARKGYVRQLIEFERDQMLMPATIRLQLGTMVSGTLDVPEQYDRNMPLLVEFTSMEGDDKYIGLLENGAYEEYLPPGDYTVGLLGATSSNSMKKLSMAKTRELNLGLYKAQLRLISDIWECSLYYSVAGVLLNNYLDNQGDVIYSGESSVLAMVIKNDILPSSYSFAEVKKEFAKQIDGRALDELGSIVLENVHGPRYGVGETSFEDAKFWKRIASPLYWAIRSMSHGTDAVILPSYTEISRDEQAGTVVVELSLKFTMRDWYDFYESRNEKDEDFGWKAYQLEVHGLAKPFWNIIQFTDTLTVTMKKKFDQTPRECKCDSLCECGIGCADCGCNSEDIDKPESKDPNEMVGPMGVGDSETERYVKPGEWMTYTVYFENKAEATAAAQEVTVTNPLSEYLDWSTFEMGEVAFNNQIDLGLSGKQNGESVVDLKDTNYKVKSTVKLDQKKGKVDWYLRIVDPSTDTGWPDDVFAGFLPPNDETFRGEGHLTYRVKVREDAPALVRIDNAATIIFDYNDPIPTDPAWWNTVAPEKLSPKFVDSELAVYEGETAEIKVFGGALEEEMSAKLYLTHNTSSAADIQKGLKFPMTLTWAKGEIGYKTISIPTLVDKTIEDEEFFTCHIDESVITVTIKDAGFEELAAKIEDGTASAAEIKTWQKLLKGKKLYGRAIPSPYEGGKVSGSKAVAVGAKMSFKATANKGYAPIGWYEGENLITKDAAYSFIMPQTNVTYVAKFMKADEDANEITIDVGGTTGDVDNLVLAATNLYVGVKVDMPVVSSAISATTVKIAKLPAGLKYDAKLGMITGVPTKSGTFNATFTVTTAGKISKVFTMPITTTAMQPWAIGTFNGGFVDSEGEECGLVTLTTTAAGKISGKILKPGFVNGDVIGQTWTVSAASFEKYDEEGYHATLTAKSGKLAPETCEIVISEEGVVGSNEYGEKIEAYWNFWKTPEGKLLGKELAANPEIKKNGLPLPEGFDLESYGLASLTLKFAASGAVTATGMFDVGAYDKKGNPSYYKATCSTVLISAKEGYRVHLYFAPNAKKNFDGEAFALEMSL